MKKSACICLLLLVLFSCENSEDVIQLNPTEMEVRVLDASGNIVPGAEVKIFRNSRDWEMISREVDTQITDENGIAYFTDLLPVNYFYFVSYERNGRLITNQTVDTSFGRITGTNYELADFLTDNAVTRVTVTAGFEKLRGSEISEVIISDVNVFFSKTFDSEPATQDTILLNLGTVLEYDQFTDNLDDALIGDPTFYDEVEFTDLNSSLLGRSNIFFNSAESIVSVEEFEESSFVLFEFDDEFFFSTPYQVLPIEFTDFSTEDKFVPHTLVLGEILFGNDVYSVEVILDYL